MSQCHQLCDTAGDESTPDVLWLLQIRTIDRVCEIPHEGPFCDLMWSDPEDIETWAVSPRGAGWLFGRKVTSEFNSINGEGYVTCFVLHPTASAVASGQDLVSMAANVDFGCCTTAPCSAWHSWCCHF